MASRVIAAASRTSFATKGTHTPYDVFSVYRYQRAVMLRSVAGEENGEPQMRHHMPRHVVHCPVFGVQKRAETLRLL